MIYYGKTLFGYGPKLTAVQNGLACPARFERATYALEEFVAAGMCIYFNCLQRKNATV